MKSKLEIYALAVCFAAVVCLVISVSVVGYSIIRIVNPALTMPSYNYNRYQTNDRFWDSIRSRAEDQSTVKRPPEQDLTKQRLEALTIDLEGEKRDGLQSLIRALMFVVVGAVVLLLHWRIARKARS